jgi:hypothetical protein
VNIQKNILATLAYFNLFDYPLKKQEIMSFLSQAFEPYEFDQAMNELLNEQLIFRIGNFFSIRNETHLADRRQRGNDKAAGMMRTAQSCAKIIAAFPFVKAVAVSGSLSKNFAEDDADIDFFIITASNRLWLARSLLHLFKKLTFLAGREHLFCMNYFVDESQLCILEKNIYTAIEAVTLLPMRGNFERFYEENNWTKKILPNAFCHAYGSEAMPKSFPIKIFEVFFDNRFGGWLDNFLMKLTASRWGKKTIQRKRNGKGNVLAMHSGKHFSKPAPENFQKKLLQRYEKELHDIFALYDHRLLKEII